MNTEERSGSMEQPSGERRSGDRVQDDQRSGEGSASALSRHKMLERKHGFDHSDTTNEEE